MEREEKLCHEVETVREFTCLGDRVIANEECEAAMTARRRCGCVKFTECSELLYCRKFPLKLYWAVCMNYVMPAILYECDAWCLYESKMGILRTQKSVERAIYGALLKDNKIAMDLMLMLG